MESKIATLGYLNIIRKFFVFWKYLLDNLQNKQWRLIHTSIKYLFFKQSNSKNMIVKSNIGKFFIRKNTIDFKLVNSAYEWFVIRVFKKEIVDADLFVDIGANIGTYSIIAAKEGLLTIAFEPTLSNFNSLLKNIELNKFKHLIKPFRFGLGTSNTEIEFNINPIKPGASGVNPIKKNGQKEIVTIKKFDELQIEEIKTSKNVLVKIDVEGMELDVLNGMKDFIKSTKHLSIIIESKHIGENKIEALLNTYAQFTISTIDRFNTLAYKTN